VFRTFGEDLPSVVEDFNAFCEGRHPLFPGVRLDGSDGEPDYRVSAADPEAWGTFHRDEATGLSVVMGTIEQPGEGRFRDVADRSIAFYNRRDSVKVISGAKNVREYWLRRTARCGTIAMHDYFAYWKATGQSTEGGKVFFYDLVFSSIEHALFFDDNIRFSDFFIVKPINLQEPTGKPSIIHLLRTHVCRAEPLEAISDRQYFVRHVARLEEGYERALRSRANIRALFHNVQVVLDVFQRMHGTAGSDELDGVVQPLVCAPHVRPRGLTAF